MRLTEDMLVRSCFEAIRPLSARETHVFTVTFTFTALIVLLIITAPYLKHYAGPLNGVPC